MNTSDGAYSNILSIAGVSRSMFRGLMARAVSQGESRAAGLGVVLTGVNNPTLVMKKLEGEKELSCGFLHHGRRILAFGKRRRYLVMSGPMGLKTRHI